MKNIIKRFFTGILVGVFLLSASIIPTQAYTNTREYVYSEIIDLIHDIGIWHNLALHGTPAFNRPEWAQYRDELMKSLESKLRTWLLSYESMEDSGPYNLNILSAYFSNSYFSDCCSANCRRALMECFISNSSSVGSIIFGTETAVSRLAHDIVGLLYVENEDVFDQRTKIVNDIGTVYTWFANGKRFPSEEKLFRPTTQGISQRIASEIMGSVISSYYERLDPKYGTDEMKEYTNAFGKALITGDYLDVLITKPVAMLYGKINKTLEAVNSEAERNVLLFQHAQAQSYMAAFNTSFDKAFRANTYSASDEEILQAFKDCVPIYEERQKMIDNAKTIEELSDILQSFYVNIDPEPICLKKEGFTFHTEQVDAIVGNAPIVVMQDSVDVTNQFTIQTDEENRVTVTPKSNVSYDTPYNIYYDAADYKTAKRTIMYTQDESKIKDNNASLSDVTVLTESGTTSNITFDNYCAYVSDFSQIENTIFDGKNCVSSYDRFGNATLTVTAADGISSAIYKIYKTTSVKDASGNELYTFSVKPQSKYTLKIEFNNLQEQYANNMYIAVYDEDNHLQNIRTCQNAEYIEYTDDMTLKILNFGVQSMTPWANAYMLEAK